MVHNVAMRHIGVAVIAAGSVAVIAAAGVGIAAANGSSTSVDGNGTPTADGTHIALEIVTSQQGRAAGLGSVTCPLDEPLEVGHAFTCTASNGAAVSVTITSSLGDFDWSITAG